MKVFSSYWFMKKVGLLFTGWTFLSEEGASGREISRSFSDKNQEKTRKLLRDVLWNCNIISKEIYNIDSSDIDPKHWLLIRDTIASMESEWDFEGYVLIHGTDTLEYTASALSFLLRDIRWNLIITGSMDSIAKEGTDAIRNLHDSFNTLDQIKGRGGHYVVFGGRVLQGNKVKKMDTHSKTTFIMPWTPNLWEVVGERLILNEEYYQKYQENVNKNIAIGECDYSPLILPKVQIIKFFPWMDMEIFDYLWALPDLKWIILEWYGDGNFPKSNLLMKKLQNLIFKNIFIVIKSQCLTWFTDHKYQGWQQILGLDDTYVISGKKMNSATTMAKLMYVLSQDIEVDRVKEVMEKDIAGEML